MTAEGASSSKIPVVPWLVTGDDPQMLRRNAASLRAHLDGSPELDAGDVGLSLSKREQRRHRAVSLGVNTGELRESVAELAAGSPTSSVVRGVVRGDDRVVMVFPGQGWQWLGMAAELRHESPVFAQRLAQCDAALAPYMDVSVLDVLNGDGWGDVELMQPVLWSVMVALARQWESVGITPDAVLGHSQGETAAAVVAGALSLEDGARIVTAYARAIKRRLSGHGGMVSIGLSADRVETLIRPWAGRAWVGVLNGPSVTVVSGEPQALNEILSACETEGTWARRVDMDYAPHCPMVDPVTAELREAFTGLQTKRSRVPFYSTVTGGRVDSATLDVDYWVANLRSPIRFVDAVRAMVSDGYRVFVEASAHPVLGVGMQEAFDEAGVGPQSVALGTLRRDDGGWRRFFASRAQLWANGVAVDWSGDFPHARHVELPQEESQSGETDAVFDLSGLSVDAQRRRMVDLVRRHAAAVLGVETGTVAADTSFQHAGMDSPRAVELRSSLNDATGLDLPAAVVYSHPTPTELAERIRRDLTGEPESETTRIAETQLQEPIAIVGMACRFPGGVASPQDLWRLVADGVDAMGEFPTDRGWNLEELYDPSGQRRGTSYVDKGAFLHDAADFDAEFFGISPREALSMDPQQRLTLEVAWEALERAGIDPSALKGTDTGVYVGASAQEYGSRLDQAPEELEGQMLTGTTNSVVSGRVAYTLGLQGPALTVDTACSASLVGLHLAMQGLRQGDCALAIAGGVTVMARPGMHVEISRQGGLAADGRCKAFSAAADGTNWAEGVAMLAVERLSDARRLGHQVLAVVRGSAVNQDGASNGLSAPSGPAQERVIRHALAAAGLSTDDVDAVEAHGTGTKLGDPIEAQAILNTYGQSREADRPVYLGSLKSNIGHAQAAAGVGGVIKMVMAIHNGQIPKTLHAEEPTPHVDWSSGAVELLREPVSWPDRERARRAAVSSFGISGTNAHVILEQDPVAHEPERDASIPDENAAATMWTLSAHSPESLTAQAERLASHARAHPELGVADIGYSLATTRAAFAHKATVVGTTRDELLAGLAAIATGDAPPDSVVTATAASRGAGPVMVFPGQGSQWVGMGAELAERFPVFAQAMDECAAALRPHTGRDLWDDLNGDITPIEVVQPLLWAVMVSLARLWQSFGVEPAAVVGHSQGEVAAAVVSGRLSIEDGARVIALRSVSAQRLSGMGDIVSVPVPVEEAEQRIAGLPGLSVAAVNGPSTTVVSGDEAGLESLVVACEADGIQVRRIRSGYPTHSPHVDVLRDELVSTLDGIRPRPGDVPMWSTVTATPVSGAQLDADYWFTNMRHTVQFAPVVRELIASGYDSFIEVSPHPVLTTAIHEIAEQSQTEVSGTATLRRGDGDDRRFLTSLAEAHTNGIHGVNWPALYPNAAQVPLPTYPFQRQRYWIAPPVAEAGADAGLLGVHVAPLAETDQALLTAHVSAAHGGWPADHAAAGDVLVPGAALVELARQAGEAVGCGRVEELTIQRPLRLTGGARFRLQVAVKEPDADDSRPVAVHCRPVDAAADTAWTKLATGSVAAHSEPQTPAGPGAWPPPRAQRIDVSRLYPTLEEQGYQYGPAFQGLTAAWRLDDKVYGEVELAAEQGAEVGNYGIHPALLDAAMHTALIDRAGSDGPALPFTWSGFEVFATDATTARVVLTHTGTDTMSAVITDRDGGLVATVGSLEVRPLVAAPARAIEDGQYVTAWSPVDVSLREADWRWWGDEPCEPAAFVVRTIPEGKAGAVSETLELVQSWLRDDAFTRSKLVIVATEDTAMNAAALALVRSSHTENPGRFGIVHMRDGVSDADLAAALSALDAGEFEVDVVGGALRAARLRRPNKGSALTIPDGPWRLDAPEPGVLRGAARADRPLEPGQARVRLAARGLNFRDVVAWMGMVPGLTGLGVEGAGTVTEVAADVTGLAVGERVMGMVTDGMADETTTDARNLTHVPPQWTFTRAASVCGIFLTAWLSLSDCIKPGDRVVIHSATGGVGTAAMQVAEYLGAEVFATASPAKQHLLHQRGLDSSHIASTRTLDFAERFRSATGGEGVDVVLNSLAGEYTDASLGLLRPGGRLVELGKTDVRDPGDVAAAYEGVEYRYFDLMAESPDTVAQALKRLSGPLQDGTFDAPPVTSLPMTRAREGFELMREAAHTGKIVLTEPQKFDPDRTVLITGGTGTLGGLLARHLVTAHGVKHLLLVSRRGIAAAGATELKSDLEASGATVTVASCDVTDRAALSALLDSVSTAKPLGTVVHAAGILDDAFVQDLDEKQLARVFAVKARSAALLDELTDGLDLQAFVMFSSIAGVIGAPGQANYAAANGYLDGIARNRRRRGLPATSVAWGLWETATGMTEHLGPELEHLAREGVATIDTETGLGLFDAALRADEPVTVAALLDMPTLRRRAGDGDLPALFRDLVSAVKRRVAPDRADEATGLPRRLANATADERERLLVDVVCREGARVLRMDSGRELAPRDIFREVGFDSLTAVELRNRLNRVTGLQLPSTVVFRHPTPVELADRLLTELDVEPEPSFMGDVDRLRDRLSALADSDPHRAEAVVRLRALLRELDAPAIDDDLDTATDDEMYALIDKELGIE